MKTTALTTEQAREFVGEIHKVCQKFGIRIMHEDCHGAFILAKSEFHGFEHADSILVQTTDDHDGDMAGIHDGE